MVCCFSGFLIKNSFQVEFEPFAVLLRRRLRVKWRTSITDSRFVFHSMPALIKSPASAIFVSVTQHEDF